MKWIVRWLVMGVVLGGTAYAQEKCDVPSIAQWNALSNAEQDAWLEKCATPVPVSTVHVAPAVKKKPQPLMRSSSFYNKNLGIAGGLIATIGVILMTPQGNNVYLPSETYCVTSTSAYVEVENGSCRAQSVKYGAYLLASGGAMMLIGFHHVSLFPQVTPTKKAVTATIRWGGKR